MQTKWLTITWSLIVGAIVAKPTRIGINLKQRTTRATIAATITPAAKP
jgi:hypothetical protein